MDARWRWARPPKNPWEFALVLRQAHAGREADPEGHSWPWSSDAIVNRGFFLSEDRERHEVTHQLKLAAASLDQVSSVKLSMAVRYRCSARGAAQAYKDAMVNSTLEIEVLKPLKFPNRAPYRCTIRACQLAPLLSTVSESCVAQLPFTCLEAARDWFAKRVQGVTGAGVVRATRFASAEVARDLAMWGWIVDLESCPMETGAQQGIRLAQRFWGPEWTPAHLSKALGVTIPVTEILYCEYEKYCSYYNNGFTREYVPRHKRLTIEPDARQIKEMLKLLCKTLRNCMQAKALIGENPYAATLLKEMEETVEALEMRRSQLLRALTGKAVCAQETLVEASEIARQSEELASQSYPFKKRKKIDESTVPR
jgi:hypothetical protein